MGKWGHWQDRLPYVAVSTEYSVCHCVYVALCHSRQLCRHSEWQHELFTDLCYQARQLVHEYTVYIGLQPQCTVPASDESQSITSSVWIVTCCVHYWQPV